jgi:hypothetical protein
LAEAEERRYAHLRPGDEETLLNNARTKHIQAENKEALGCWQRKHKSLITLLLKLNYLQSWRWKQKTTCSFKPNMIRSPGVT